jgi:hypothetical protein
MGVLLDGLSNYASDRIFTDLVKESNLREGPNNNSNFFEDYGGNPGDSFSASGWPATPFYLSVVECDGVSTCIPSDYAGTYMLRYQGPTSAIETGGMSTNISNVTDAGNGYTQATMIIDSTGGAWITFNQGVSNVQLIPSILNGKPTGYTFDNYPTFTQGVINQYNSFSEFRFMGWGNTNSNPIVNWSDRTPVNTVQETEAQSGYGVAYEYMIDYCNVCNKDMWINIPVLASDDFLTQLATLILKNLRKDKNVYIEYGNEIWNTAYGFYCNQMVNYAAGNLMDTSATFNTMLRANGVGGVDNGSIGTPGMANGYPTRTGFGAGVAASRYHGLRTKQISDIFASVWGQAEINNRIRVVLAGMFAGPYGSGSNINIDLDFIQRNYGSPGNYFYQIAVAPYLNLEAPYPSSSTVNNSDSLLNGMDSTVYNIFINHNDDIYDNGPNGNMMEGFRGIARQYGVRLSTYEGGPDMNYTTGWDTAKMDAKRSPRMKQICVNYWNDWYANGNDGMFNLSDGGFSAEYKELYSWAESIHDNSQIRQAVTQIMSNPAPPVTVGWPIPGNVDARKIYGWSYCGDMYPCHWGQNPPFGGTPYQGKSTNTNAGGSAGYLINSSVNANYQLSVQASGWTDAQGQVWLDGVELGTYSVSGSSAEAVYPLTIGGKTTIPITFGAHTIEFIFTSNNSVIYQLQFTQEAIIPPAQPQMPQGELSVCTGGEQGVSYFTPYDQSVCCYQWIITGSNMTTVGATNSNTLTVNYASGFSSGTIKVRSLSINGKDTLYSAWSPTINIASASCGFQASNLTPCMNEKVTFTAQASGTSVYKWNFGDSVVVTGATTATPSVQYTSPGLKNVSLTIVTGADSTAYQIFNFINVMVCTGPVVSFSVDSTTFCPGGKVTFTGSVSDGTATSWNWNFGSGATPSSATTQTASVAYSTGGKKSITLTTNVGSSTQTITFTQNAEPVQPGTITGSASVCSGTNAVAYSVTNVAGVTYKWSYSGTGATLTPNANQASVDYAADASSGNISVTATTACGASSPSTEAIVVTSLPAEPSAISGSSSVCGGNNAVAYSVTKVEGVTYNWSYSGTGAALTANANQVSVDFAANATSGKISVTATTCGTSSPATLAIMVNAPPVPGTVSGGTTIGTGETAILTLTGNTGTIVKWQYSVSPFTSWTDTAITTASFTTQKIYTPTRFWAVVSNNNCDTLSGYATVNIVKLSTVTITVDDGSSEKPIPGAKITVDTTSQIADSAGQAVFLLTFGQHIASCSAVGYITKDSDAIPATAFEINSPSESFTISMVAGQGLKDNEWNTLSVYPNPTNDKLIVILPEDQIQQTIVTDLLGKSVIVQNITENDLLTINVNGLAKGVYYVMIITSDKSYRALFIVE